MPQKINTILLVDDDDAVNFYNKRLLIKSELAYSLVQLYNGAEAIRKIITLNKSLYNDDLVLVFLDLNMPILDGWGFLEEFKKINYALNFSVEIYILSSSINPCDIEKSKQNIFVKDYICKPLTNEKIIELKKLYSEN
jgi:CheY-like chemotaxis protein